MAVALSSRILELKYAEFRLFELSMGSKVEVRITYCCCCSLTVATVLIGIYTIIVYGVFLGLASHSVSRQVNGYPDPGTSQHSAATITTGDGVIVEVDPYYGSLGLYTEGLIIPRDRRLPVLYTSIAIFLFLIISAILLFVCVCTGVAWLLVPWLGSMALDVIRGTIFCILIFVYSDGDVRKVAVGIFFLGLQFFHMSLMLIIFAKMQRLLNKERSIEYRVERTGDKSILVDSSNMYPTLPSNYAYSSSPGYRREAGYYQPNYYNTYGGSRTGGPVGTEMDSARGNYYRPEQPGNGGSVTMHRPM